MKITNTHAALTGAALGAYTSDITDNPITGLASAGVGYGIGSLLALPQESLMEMAETLRIKQDSKYIKNRIQTGMSREQANFKSTFNRLVYNSMKPNKGNLDTNLQAISSKLKEDGILIPRFEDGKKEFLEALKTLPQPIQKSISPLLSSNNLSLFNTFKVDANKVVNKEFNIKSTVGRDAKIDYLKNIFMNEMNNPQVEALEKAKMIVDRSGVGNISIKAGVVSFNDINDDNRRVNLPVTSYDTNGVRYHNAGNGKAQAVKGFSPHALILAQRGGSYSLDGIEHKVSVDDFKQGMSPEFMLKYAGKDSRVNSVLDKITSNFMYDSNEVSEFLGNGNFTATSPQFINTSNQVDYGTVLNVDQNGNVRADKPLRDLKTTSTEKGITSEAIKVRNFLNDNGLGISSLLGVSNNDSTAIQGLTMDTISTFAPMERNVTGSALRDTSPVNPGQGIEGIKEIFRNRNAGILYGSSQVYEKLDIKNPEMFNSFLNTLSGDSATTLGDGFGLYNKAHNSSIMNQSAVNLSIPLSNNTIIANDDLLTALENGDINEYLKNNPLNLSDNNPIAYGKDGSPIGLHSRFTSGQFTRGFKDNRGNLVLQGKGFFDPNMEDSVKFFSVGSKTQASGLEDRMFKLAAAVGLEMNKGNAVYNDDGTVTIHSGSNAGTYNMEGLRNLGKNLTSSADGVTLIVDSQNTGAKELNKMLFDSNHGDTILKGMRVPSLLTGDRNSALVTAYALSETKGAEDITASIIDRLYTPIKTARDTGVVTQNTIDHMTNLANRGLIPAFNVNQLQGSGMDKILIDSSNILSRRINQTFNRENIIKNRDRYVNQMRQLIESTNIVSDVLEGRSSFIASTQAGASIVGAGKRAKMSWTALSQFMLSGHSMEDLEHFGKIDKSILYELMSFEGEGSRSNSAINSLIDGKSMELESMLKIKSPEERLQTFKNMFGDTNGNYLSYNLGYDTGSIKSLNFGLTSSSRVGKYNLDGHEIIKELDKAKLNILSLDNERSQAKGNKPLVKSIEAKLDKAMAEYSKLRTTSITGENSLLKATISLYSDLGQTKVAAPIGGQARHFVNSLERDASGNIKSVVNKAFISQAHLDDIVTQFKAVGRTGAYLQDPLIAGRTASYRVGSKKNGYSIKTIDLPEHVQTQSQLREYATSKGIKKLKANYHSNLFVPMFVNKNGDQVPLHASITREPSQGIFTSTINDLVVDRSLKTSSKMFHTVDGQAIFGAASLDFDFDAPQMLLGNVEDSQGYRKLIGTQEKVFSDASGTFEFLHELSPKGDDRTVRPVTSFNSIEEFNEYVATADIKGKARKVHSPTVTSLAINYVNALDMADSISSETKANVRVAAYRLVENLLKSSHLDTNSFLRSEQPVDILRLGREEFLNKGGSAEDYRKILEEQLPKALGKDGSGGKKNAWIDEVVKHITDAEINYSKRVDRKGNTPLDFHRISNKLGGDEATRQILASSGLFETEAVISKASVSQLYNNLGDAIVDTFKKNKGLLIGGAAALVGINLLGQSDPSFEESRRNAKMHSSKMLTAPKTEIDDVPVMPVSQSSNYILPKTFSSRQVEISADRSEQYNSDYSNIGNYEMFDPSKALNDSLFGGGFRAGNIKITDI